MSTYTRPIYLIRFTSSFNFENYIKMKYSICNNKRRRLNVFTDEVFFSFGKLVPVGWLSYWERLSAKRSFGCWYDQRFDLGGYRKFNIDTTLPEVNLYELTYRPSTLDQYRMLRTKISPNDLTFKNNNKYFCSFLYFFWRNRIIIIFKLNIN